MNYPSIKTLQTITDTKADAKRIRVILESKHRDDITEKSDAALNYVRQCFHAPPLYLVKLYAIDEILRTHGIETIDDIPGMTVEYCNTGDSYAATLCRIDRKGKVTYRVCSWGDIVERHSR